MANLNELDQWEEGIYQLETEDLVKGGEDGIDNVQAKQLANRTKFLRTQVNNLSAGKQPLDATLTALAALVTSADKMIYSTGADTFSLTTITAFARSLIAAADAKAARVVLGATKGVRRFTANGSFTVPDGVTEIYVTGCAGGGGGGAGGSSSTSVIASGGGGGGSGDSVHNIPFAVTPGQVIPITIGEDGIAKVVNPWGSGGGSGGAGGNTVIGSFVTLTGGGPGGGGGIGALSAVSAGQTGFNNGQPGGAAFLNNLSSASGGAGGSGPFGGAGAMAQQPAASGSQAWGYGVGGGGGAGVATLTNQNGGPGLPGMPGLVIIQW